MKSHEYAKKLHELADFLLSKPEFNTDWEEKWSYINFSYISRKDDFLGCVRALGAGTKEYRYDDLLYRPSGTDMLKVSVNRSAVCRKVQEEKWECEPLLSQEEEASIGAA